MVKRLFTKELRLAYLKKWRVEQSLESSGGAVCVLSLLPSFLIFLPSLFVFAGRGFVGSMTLMAVVYSLFGNLRRNV